MNRKLVILFFVFFLSFRLVGQVADTSSQFTPSEILAKKVSVNYQFVTLKSVIDDLSKRYGINFSYVSQNIPLSNKVFLKGNNLDLKTVLDNVLANSGIDYLIIEDQVVLVKSKLIRKLEKNTNPLDSIQIQSANSRNKTKKSGKKLSVSDFLRYRYLTFSSYESDDDTVEVDKEGIDSIRQAQNKLRRSRIKLINSKILNSRFTVGAIMQPELAFWKIRGNTDQSIDYKRFNNYNKPDPSYSAFLFFNYKFYKGFFIRTSFSFSNLNRKGEHKDYFISVLSPSVIQPVKSNFSSNYNYLSCFLELGYTYIYKKWKSSASAGVGQNYLLWKEAPEYLPYYEPKYYLNGPPYFNDKFKKLVPERISYRKFTPSWIVNYQLSYYLNEKIDIGLNVEFHSSIKSLYSIGNSVNEKANRLGAGVIVGYNF